MAGLLGKIDEFDPEQEEWPQYVERLEQFFEANGIVGEDNATKRRATFLAVVGPRHYKLLRSLLTPEKPTDKTFEQLTEELAKHYSPEPSEVMQRFRFNSRTRNPGESIADYLAELRRLAEFCNFGTTLKKMIRDRLVCGINNEGIQRRLLAEKELTYDKAIVLALGSEEADRNLREMRDPKMAASSVAVKQEPINQVSSKGRSQRSTPKAPPKPCYRCAGTGHKPNECRFKDVTCHHCKQKGHIAKACRNKGKAQGARPVRRVHEKDSEEDVTEPMMAIQSTNRYLPPLEVRVSMDNCSLSMEIDTGASRSVISEKQFRELWPNRTLKPSSVQLQTYSKEPLPVLGQIKVRAEYAGQEAKLPLLIVKGDGPPLMGRDWLSVIRINWHEIHLISSTGLEDTLRRHTDVFRDGLGTFVGCKAKIEVDPSARPRYCKARTLPYAMRSRVEAELERLVAEGILEPVTHSEWATPIVAALKPDKKTIRLCGDFRMTVNPVAKLDRYPVPKVEDLLATLAKGRIFTKLDLRHAYQQLLLDDDSKKYVVINTQKGLFQYTRLPFGISSAPAIFQREMEHLLQGIPGVVVYIDDILVTGENEDMHLKALDEVLNRLGKAGLRVKKDKCLFMVPSVKFLGHRIDAKGLHPLKEKVEAIEAAPIPTNLTELKAYVGLLTYYSKFLPNLSTKLAPLYELMKLGVVWKWTAERDQAFQESKKLLASDSLLVHFDESLPLTLACDASAYGLGAVLAHRYPDGSERPIGYASRTLNSAERNYSQLEKEGLALVFGIKKFYAYVFGKPFELVTDHQPLLGLLREGQPTSPQASARIRRWSIYLSMFEYTLRFRRTMAHANADALSRLPLPIEPAVISSPPELVLLTEHLATSPVSAGQIRAQTQRDPVLSQAVQYLEQGWPDSMEKTSPIYPFFTRRTELSLFEGCILWGSRVVIPSSCREAVLTELHDTHPGMSRMKSLARMYVWWPGITVDLEQTVRQCTTCQLNQATPPQTPLQPWSWPTRPWARLHLDYAGPVEGQMYLIVIDAHSKWIEAYPTTKSTSTAVINELRPLFAQFGLPETIVTDNGTCFVSVEFEKFLANNGIKHLKSAPYHPQSNGLAERAVQIVKKGLKKVTSGSPRSRLAKMLYAYRLTPQTTTGLSPAELLLGRRPRSRLDLVKPHTAERVEKRQIAQKAQHDRHSQSRKFEVNDAVFVRNYLQGDKWIPGMIKHKHSPVSFQVKLNTGLERQCHPDQLRKRTVTVESIPEIPVLEDIPPPNEVSISPDSSATPPPDEVDDPPDPPLVSDMSEPARKTYPTRVRKPIDRYEPSW